MLLKGTLAVLPCGADTAPGGNLLFTDVNGDGGANAADGISLLAFLSSDGPLPVHGAKCRAMPDCPGRRVGGRTRPKQQVKPCPRKATRRRSRSCSSVTGTNWISSNARRRRALQRFESSSGVVQGVCAHVLSVAEQFESRGEAAFRTGLRRVVKRSILNRKKYWTARRRDAGKMPRLSASGNHGVDPPGWDPGPSTIMARREQCDFAMMTVSLLLPCDQKIVRSMSQDISIDELVTRLDISREAVERTRLRGSEGFRRC